MAEKALVLLDTDDAFPDERAWAAGDTEQEALAVLLDLAPVPEGEPLCYQPTGREWLAPDPGADFDSWTHASEEHPGAIHFWKFEVGDVPAPARENEEKDG